MNPCKAKLPDGKPCPNQADEGQEYCFHHLADQVATPKKILSIALGVVTSAVIAAIFKRNGDGSKRK